MFLSAPDEKNIRHGEIQMWGNVRGMSDSLSSI